MKETLDEAQSAWVRQFLAANYDLVEHIISEHAPTCNSCWSLAAAIGNLPHPPGWLEQHEPR